jgi:50S ribosomal protein L16 3-hydroxylase
MVRQVHAALGRTRPSRADTERFLLERLSEPKQHVVFDPPRSVPAPAAFRRAADRRGVRLDLRSRMLVGRPGVALNGELFAIGRALRPPLRRLADRRALDGATIARAPAALGPLLRDWHEAGWLHLGCEDSP